MRNQRNARERDKNMTCIQCSKRIKQCQNLTFVVFSRSPLDDNDTNHQSNEVPDPHTEDTDRLRTDVCGRIGLDVAGVDDDGTPGYRGHGNRRPIAAHAWRRLIVLKSASWVWPWRERWPGANADYGRRGESSCAQGVAAYRRGHRFRGWPVGRNGARGRGTAERAGNGMKSPDNQGEVI